MNWWREKMFAIRSNWIASEFKHWGSKCRMGRIGYLIGAKYISVGDGSSFQDGIYLSAWDKYMYRNSPVSKKMLTQRMYPSITIGNNCSFGAWNHITCTNRIVIGDNCLTGKWVTITDNNHGSTDMDSLQVMPGEREIVSKGPVIIGRKVWIGDKATILAGVTVGDGAVIAANCVVTRDVPAYSVIAGNPGRIVKHK